MGLIRSSAAPATDPSATLLSLAVLLGAGTHPAQSWRHLAGTGDADARRIAERIDRGADVPAAIAAEGGGAWGDVAAAWEVAETVGAPLAGTLRAVGDSLRDGAEVRDDVRIALAEPTASARLLSWLPLVGLAVAGLLGLDPLGVLFGTTAGLVCVVAGLALIACSMLWTRRLVAAARPSVSTPGMHEELLAAALSGGVSIARAQRVLAECADWSEAARDESAEADRVLELSRAAGVPAVELLRASAAHARHRARTDGRLAAARLGTRLLVPMGVCTLPAFLLLGVAPMLMSVVAATPIPAFAG